MGRQYYVIDSIKGGCGKTTFAIMLTRFLEDFYEKEKEKEKKRKRACLLDVDFLGTGLINIFLSKERQERFKNDYFYITQKIRNYQSDRKKYIYPCEVDGNELLVGFGDPDYGRKTGYHLMSEFNHVPVISYGIFRKGVRDILDEDGDGLETQIDGTVESVILDMSPSVDAFSETVKDSLFDKRNRVVSAESKVYYFLMLGIDSSHIAATRNYFKSFICSDNKVPDKIFVVINDPLKMGKAISESEGGEEKTIYDAATASFKNELLQGVVSQEIEDRIFFLVSNQFDDYAKHINARKPLEGTKDNLFLDIPVRFYGSWEDPSLKLAEDKGEFKKWLTK